MTKYTLFMFRCVLGSVSRWRLSDIKIYIRLDIHINVLMAPQSDYVRMYNHCDHDEGVVYEVSPSYCTLKFEFGLTMRSILFIVTLVVKACF